MTEAEQVACDALRSAGLDELADNLKFAREVVRLRVVVTEMLECDTEGCCAACGVHAESETHRLSCRLVPLFATKEGWAAEELERAHGEALRQERMRTPSPLGEWAQRQPGRLLSLDPATWRLNDVVTGAPRAVVTIVNQSTAVVKPSEHGHE